MAARRGTTRKRAPSIPVDVASSIIVQGPEDDDTRGIQESILLNKRFQDIEERRLKEWDDYQRAQRSRSNLEVSNPKVFLDLAIGEAPAGRLIVELMEDLVPLTVQNFRRLITGECHYHKETGIKLDYIDSTVTKIVPGCAVYLGELGCVSIAANGETFPDENFSVRHMARGYLSMVNHGPHTNGSAFCITLDRVPSLDFRQVVFGRIVDPQSLAVLEKIEQLPLHPTGQPASTVTITLCGALTGTPEQRPPGVHVSAEAFLSKAENASEQPLVDHV